MRIPDAYIAKLDTLCKKAIELGLSDYQFRKLVSAANRKETKNMQHQLALLDRSISDTARLRLISPDVEANVNGFLLN